MHKPKIDRVLAAKMLTGAACIGVVITSYFAVKKGSKVIEKIEETKDELSAEENKDKGKLEVAARYISRVAPVIAPVVIAGGATEACIIGAQVLSLKEIAALTGTVGYLIANRKALEEAICELPGGKEALEKAKKKVSLITAEKKIEENEKAKHTPWKQQTIEDTGNGDDLFLDEWSGRLFLSSEAAVRKGFDNFNSERDEGMDLPYNGHSDMNLPPASSYNELFEAWDLVPSGLGWHFGWPASDDYYDHRSIPYTIETIPVTEMNDKELKKYGKDLHIIRIPEGFYPMECYLEV